MEIGKKKNKRGRRCREMLGRAADPHDHHLEKTNCIMMSKSNKKLKYHHQYSESRTSCKDASLPGPKNNTSSCCTDIGCRKEERMMKVGAVGVFDFPWLEEEGEGVIFKLGDDLCHPGPAGIMGLLEDYTFALYSTPCFPSAYPPPPPPHHHDPVPFTTTFSHMEDNLCCSSSSSSALPLLFHHQAHPKAVTQDDDKPLSPYNVDSKNNINQQMDCIWSSVLDQPLDINLNIL